MNPRLALNYDCTIFSDAPIITPHQEMIVIQVSRQGTVPCGQRIISFPPASFTWTKLTNDEREREIRFNSDPSNGSLLLDTTDYSDAGTYTCTAENSVGTTSTKVMVLVLGKTLVMHLEHHV